jgi:hypothetical protein
MRLLALAGGLVLVATAALAQDVDTVVVADAGFMNYLIGILDLLIEPIVVMILLPLVLRGFSWLGVKLDEGKRNSLQATITNVAGGYLNELGEEAKHLKLDVRDPRLKKWITLAQQRAPDAMRWADLGEAAIAGRIIEKIPQIAPPASDPAPNANPVRTTPYGKEI